MKPGEIFVSNEKLQEFFKQSHEFWSGYTRKTGGEEASLQATLEQGDAHGLLFAVSVIRPDCVYTLEFLLKSNNQGDVTGVFTDTSGLVAHIWFTNTESDEHLYVCYSGITDQQKAKLSKIAKIHPDSSKEYVNMENIDIHHFLNLGFPETIDVNNTVMMYLTRELPDGVPLTGENILTAPILVPSA